VGRNPGRVSRPLQLALVALTLAVGACETAPSAPSPYYDWYAPPDYRYRPYYPSYYYGGFFPFRHEHHEHHEHHDGGHQGHHH
jgi:hypothetical protein